MSYEPQKSSFTNNIYALQKYENHKTAIKNDLGYT